MSAMYTKAGSKSLRAALFRRCFQQRTFTKATQAPTLQVRDAPAPHHGRIRILSLNHPPKRNAISRQLLQELSTEIAAIERQTTPGSAPHPHPDSQDIVRMPGVAESRPIRAVIIASEVDSAFCSGADLQERASFSAADTLEFLDRLRHTFNSLAHLTIPTLAAVSATALGGGLELALCTHFRVMASTAQVGLPETRLGIIPGAGGTHRLPALIGLSRARDLIVTGRLVSAAEAYFLGIADRLVEVLPQEATDPADQKADLMRRAREEVLKEALVLANQICEGGPVAVQCALQAVNWAAEEMENQMYMQVLRTEDRTEALRAFMEKRKPIFSGR
ncbi:hypothetical protein K3495_g14284 [Podosphaera aphanis]|nr:hypothetical protein K3495_g14284 [Podosphaera aphanis]